MDDRGFAIVERVVSGEACDALLGALPEEGPGRGRAGTRHLMAHAAVAALARREDLLAIARGFVGPAAVPYRATLFAKSGHRNWLVVWHQDTALPLAARVAGLEWGPWSVKEGILCAHAPAWALSRIVALRVHLDASTRENGPLRVIPGSHLSGVLSDEQVFRAARERAAVECLAGRGAVVAMRPLLIHASSKALGPAPRRVLHIEYAASLDLGPGVRLAIA